MIQNGWNTFKSTVSPYVTWVRPASRGLVVYTLADRALANLLALESMRHGTCWRNYILIQLSYADPAQGGKAPGEYQHMEIDRPDHDNNCLGRFFMWKDRIHSPGGWIEKRAKSWQKTYQSTRAWLGAGNNSIVSFLIACTTPTLRFRFDPREVDRNLRRDSKSQGAKYSQRKICSWARTGISGSLIQGIKNPNWFRRLKFNPHKPFLGAFQGAVALSVLSRYFPIAKVRSWPRLVWTEQSWLRRLANIPLAAANTAIWVTTL